MKIEINSSVWKVEKDGVILLFNRHNLEIALLSEKAFYHDRSDNCIAELKRLKMIGDAFGEYSLSDVFPDHISKAYLLFGTDCNIDCKYCTVKYNTRKDSRQPVMTEDTLKHSMNFLFSEGQLEQITLYGGEPMLHRQRILQFFDSFKNYPMTIQPRIDLITNGLVRDKELMNCFKENNVFIIVSLDGNREQHDTFRRDKKGNGTFTKVIEGIHEYQDCGLSVGVSLVLGKHNYQSIGSICSKLKRELNITSIGITLPHMEPDIVSSREFERFLTEQYSIILETCQEEQLWFEQGMKRLKSLIAKQRYIYGCPSSSKGCMIRILPNGAITLCENMGLRGKYTIGNVNDHFMKSNDIYNNPHFVSWYSRCTNEISKCRDCRAYAICGMGCPYDAFLQNGTIRSIERRSCMITLQAIDWFLDRIIKNNKLFGEIQVLDRASRIGAMVNEPWKK